MTPEMMSRIAQYRQKTADGTITLEEYIEAIKLIREDRRSASVSSETARKAKAKVAVPSADDLLNELGG